MTLDKPLYYVNSTRILVHTGLHFYLTFTHSLSACQMGSIRLRNHDGSIKVLIDVRYVSKLKNNLISLGALESKGLVVMIRDGVLNVISDSLLVMKGTRRNNLYYYNGSTVIGVVAMVSSSGKD